MAAEKRGSKLVLNFLGGKRELQDDGRPLFTACREFSEETCLCMSKGWNTDTMFDALKPRPGLPMRVMWNVRGKYALYVTPVNERFCNNLEGAFANRKERYISESRPKMKTISLHWVSLEENIVDRKPLPVCNDDITRNVMPFIMVDEFSRTKPFKKLVAFVDSVVSTL